MTSFEKKDTPMAQLIIPPDSSAPVDAKHAAVSLRREFGGVQGWVSDAQVGRDKAVARRELEQTYIDAKVATVKHSTELAVAEIKQARTIDSLTKTAALDTALQVTTTAALLTISKNDVGAELAMHVALQESLTEIEAEGRRLGLPAHQIETMKDRACTNIARIIGHSQGLSDQLIASIVGRVRFLNPPTNSQ
jgi:phage gp36-like protein